MKKIYILSLILLALLLTACDHKISTKFDPDDSALAPKAPTNIRA